MVNEKEEKKMAWVNAKKFMREHGYNDLCLFLCDDNCANSSCVSLLSENGKHSKEDSSRIDTSDDFFPLFQLSNSVFINIEKKDWVARLDLLKTCKFGRHNYLLTKRHREPNWPYWKRLEYWSALEASFLLFGEEPDSNYDDASSWWYPINAIVQLSDLIKRAFRAGEIAGFYDTTTVSHPEEFDYEIIQLNQIYTRKGNFGAWLKKMNFAVPEELKDAISSDAPNESLEREPEAPTESDRRKREPEALTESEIRKLKITLLDDQIELTMGSKKPVCEPTRSHFGPSSKSVEKGLLTKLLTDGYLVGTGDVWRRQLRRVEKKLKDIIEKALSLSLPPGFTLLTSDRGSNEFRPVFRCGQFQFENPKDPKEFSEQLAAAVRAKNEDDVNSLCMFGRKEGWLSDKQIQTAYNALAITEELSQEPKNTYDDLLVNGIEKITNKP